MKKLTLRYSSTRFDEEALAGLLRNRESLMEADLTVLQKTVSREIDVCFLPSAEREIERSPIAETLPSWAARFMTWAEVGEFLRWPGRDGGTVIFKVEQRMLYLDGTPDGASCAIFLSAPKRDR